MPTKSHFQLTMTHREALPANRPCFPCLHSLFRWVLEDDPVFSHFWISWNLAIIALQNWCFRRAPRRPWTTLMLPRASHPSTVTCTHLGDERNKVTPSLCLEVTRSHATNVECKVRCLKHLLFRHKNRNRLTTWPGRIFVYDCYPSCTVLFPEISFIKNITTNGTNGWGPIQHPQIEF